MPVPFDLSKLSDVVKNDVEKDAYGAKIKIPDITNLATKTTLNPKTNKDKGEIRSIDNLATNAALKAKINEFVCKIPNTTNLAITTALTAVENKILNISKLVQKTDYNTKLNDIKNKITDHDQDKCITTPEFDTLTAENFAQTLKQANLARKSDIANILKREILMMN